MKHLIIFLFPLLIISCNTDQKTKDDRRKTSLKPEGFIKNQVLLTNYATFKGGQSLNGASAFLIEYKNTVYAVTAKHLIGEAGGVTPEVNQTALSTELLSWKMFPRVPIDPSRDTVVVNATHLNYQKNKSDALLLNTISNHSNIKPLIPCFNIPTTGDSLFLIGCPYSETDCKQNIYKALFLNVEQGFLRCEIKFNIEMAGFSGAPLLNSEGQVVGIIYGGGESDGKNYILATPINEIQSIE
ncbi:MAG: Trypsin [Bacteroidetes bacterium]|nr:Trypsin [Bacteroidota bacterium]